MTPYALASSNPGATGGRDVSDGGVLIRQPGDHGGEDVFPELDAVSIRGPFWMSIRPWGVHPAGSVALAFGAMRSHGTELMACCAKGPMPRLSTAIDAAPGIETPAGDRAVRWTSSPSSFHDPATPAWPPSSKRCRSNSGRGRRVPVPSNLAQRFDYDECYGGTQKYGEDGYEGVDVNACGPFGQGLRAAVDEDGDDGYDQVYREKEGE